MIREDSNENYDSSERWLGTPLSTLYLRPLSRPMRSVLLLPHFTEEETEARSASNLPKVSREAGNHDRDQVWGWRGQRSGLGGDEGDPEWPSSCRGSDGQVLGSVLGVWKA